jgi:hypothetical protein
MFATGIPTAEKPQARKFYLMSHGPDVDGRNANAWRHYKVYLERTSILIPIPPAVYSQFPVWLKRTVLLDFSMYYFDEEKDGPKVLAEARKGATPRE